MDTAEWEWDETLFSGSAAHYGLGRMPYPRAVADAVRDELGLDGTGRLLDVGCGPGSLTMLLAPFFASAVGVDADLDMIAEARRRSAEVDAADIAWRHLRGEDLPAGLGTFRVTAFAQSFHWMDQALVARQVRDMLEPGGAWVHVGGTTHRGAAGGTAPLPHPNPPWEQIEDLVTTYLGPVRRAGRRLLPCGTRTGEETVMRQAGYGGPTRIAVAGGRIVERGLDAIVSAVFSLSSSAPQLFGDRRPAFEAELRGLLRDATPSGRFAELTTPIEVLIWRP